MNYHSSMNKLNIQKRCQIISLLLEGNSMRAVSRLVGCSINTVTKLLVDVGSACSDYLDKTMVNLPCKKIQCDEIWSFCYSKQKNVAPEHEGQLGFGDVYTWTSICAETKLVPSFLIGKRDSEYAYLFIDDLAKRFSSRIQLTTDGHRPYIEAVEDAFKGNIDYAMLVKIYGAPEGKKKHRYIGAEKTRISGFPDEKHISTSFVERQNLTMRMGMRRFMRRTNGFSKKIENLEYAVALHFMHYNFARIHKTLRVTPAMEAGVSRHVWEIEEIVCLRGEI